MFNYGLILEELGRYRRLAYSGYPQIKRFPRNDHSKYTERSLGTEEISTQFEELPQCHFEISRDLNKKILIIKGQTQVQQTLKCSLELLLAKQRDEVRAFTTSPNKMSADPALFPIFITSVVRLYKYCCPN